MSQRGALTGQTFLHGGSKRLSVKLTTLIASSGEGFVYNTSQTGSVAKIYNAPQADHFRKLSVMIANPPRDPAAPAVSIAWPTSILTRAGGEPVGFLMPEIADAKRLVILYVPKTRLASAPGVDWFYLHSAALNLARLFRTINGFGYVVGDVKPENLLVNSSMQICAIDTDSFQVKDPITGSVYRCPVGTADYTPPELFGLEFKEVDRTASHDLFGLAALIYLFLFGKHPFSGGRLPDRLVGMETAERIKNGLWQWNRANPLAPHRGSLPIDIVHPKLEQLFRRCFDRGAQKPEMRPTAEEWERTLETAIDDLVWCKTSSLHVHASHRGCPWCKSVRQGVDLFPTKPGLSSSSFSNVLRRLDLHIQNGDLTAAASIIEKNPQLKTDIRATKARAAINKNAKILTQFTRFKEAICRAPEHDIENLAALRSVPQELLSLAEKNQATAQPLLRLRQLALAIDDVEKAVQSARPKNALYGAKGEEALLAAVRTYAQVLASSPSTFPRYKDRLRDAWARTEAMQALTKAEGHGQLRATALALASHWSRLNELAEFRARETHYREVRELADKIASFVATADRPGADPDVVCAIWEAAPDLATSGLAREPLANEDRRTPNAIYEQFVSRRQELKHLSETLNTIVPPGHPYTEAALKAASTRVKSHITKHGEIPALSALFGRIATLNTAAGMFADIRKLVEGGEERLLDLGLTYRGYDGPTLTVAPDLDSAIKRAAALLSYVEAFSSAAADPAKTEADLVHLWTSGNLAHPAAANTPINGSTIQERVALASRRITVGAEIEAAIATADSDPMRTHEAESAILKIWADSHELLAPWGGAQVRLRPRVEAARDRLMRARAFMKALAEEKPEEAARAWGTDGCLETFEQTSEYARTAVEAATVVETAERVVLQLAAAPSDEQSAVEMIAPAVEAHPIFSKAPLSGLKGRSLSLLLDHLRARAAFRRKLEACDMARGHELFALANDWDHTYGQDDPQLAATTTLKEAVALRARWTLLCNALRENDDGTVAKLWGDARLEGAADFNANAGAIQGSLQRHLDSKSRFQPLARDAVKAHSFQKTCLTWQWEDACVTHAVIMLGDRAVDASDRQKTITRHVVSRAAFESEGGALLPFSGRMMTALVFPAFKIRDLLVHAAEPIALQEQMRRHLRYRVQGNAPHSKTRELELIADRSLLLPPLCLVVDEAGTSAEIVAHFPSVALDKDARMVLPLSSRSSLLSVKKLVRLDYGTPEDAEWLQIEHPDPADRKIAVAR